MEISAMTKDEQARARIVEIALQTADIAEQMHRSKFAAAFDDRIIYPLTRAERVRRRAGFKNPRTGSWCAAGLTAAMEDAGLVVPAPGTPARRGAVALLDWVLLSTNSSGMRLEERLSATQILKHWDSRPGDIIAWLQYPPGKDPAGWRRGHVALIVAVDDVSITTVGWNEGPAPGRVMKRRLWRHHGHVNAHCDPCGGTCRVKPSTTVLHRKPSGLLYGIARPVAR